MLHKLAVTTTLFCLASASGAQEPVDFVRQIAPILEQRCLRCHSAEKAKGKLSFSSAADFRRGGASGAAIVVGKPDESRLVQMVTGAKPEMPASGAPLVKREVDVLRQWIAAGAEWPANVKLKERAAGGLDWWSFQPVKRPEVPTVKLTTWPRNDLDKFVLAKLEEAGLAPAKEADRRTLIRRLSFDLLGLPPSSEDVAAFVNDPDPEAYDKLVDRVLQSPHYGERWARHWLDIAHYADTHGFERDQRRDNAWPYRDYVIRALNSDKRYDDFLREQIAGDVLRPGDGDAITATGFLAAGPWDFVGQVETRSDVLRRAARADDLDDMVTQVMTVACAMTVNCARCHDHKLDPISQAEYYQLWAVFAGVKRGDRPRGDPKAVQVVDEKLKSEQRDLRAAIGKFRGDRWSLADIVGGGDGKGTGKPGGGIDQFTGKPLPATRGYAKGKANAFVKSTVKFVDGVVVPDASDDGTPVSSTGLRVKGVPKTSTQAWDAVRYGPLLAQKSTRLGDVDYNTDGHVLLGLHANGAITFDLEAIRKAGAPSAMKFSSRVGYFGETPEGGASIFVFVDGDKKFERPGIGRKNGPIAIEIDLLETNRFLTLMVTDNGNGISNDQVCFIDAELSGGMPKTLDPDQRARLSVLEKKLAELDKREDSRPKDGKVYAVVSGAPPVVKVLHRGDPEQSRAEVKPGTLSFLTGVSGELKTAANTEGARRLALADWIVNPANPLTRRVIVNRLWHHHFGVGLVDTPSDFGFGGGKASHPELLDWLAEVLAAGEWKLKRMHRLMCTSATYRQASNAVGEPQRKIDSGNRLLWRMNGRRLDAESLRDAVLFTSGTLNRDMFGPGYRDFKYTEAYAPIYDYVTPDRPELWRRTIYRFVVRTTSHQFLTTLDCPSPANLTPVRSVTTTALQSLALLNNDLMLKQAGYFADRVRKEAQPSPEAQARRAFELAFGRSATDAEIRAAVVLVNSDGLPQLCRMLMNANEFAYVD